MLQLEARPATSIQIHNILSQAQEANLAKINTALQIKAGLKTPEINSKVIKEVSYEWRKIAQEQHKRVGSIGFEDRLKQQPEYLSQKHSIATLSNIDRIIQSSTTIQSSKRTARQLTQWEDYFNNQAERDAEIKLRLADFNNATIADQSGLSDKDREAQFLKEFRQLAPEQVLKKFLRPESYNPRNKTFKEMVGVMEQRGDFGEKKYKEKKQANPGETSLAQIADLKKQVAKLESELRAAAWLNGEFQQQNTELEKQLKGSQQTVINLLNQLDQAHPVVATANQVHKREDATVVLENGAIVLENRGHGRFGPPQRNQKYSS